MANRLFETYKNTVMPHGNHMLKNHLVGLEKNSKNMTTLVKTDKYGAIYTTDTTTLDNMCLNERHKPTHFVSSCSV